MTEPIIPAKLEWGEDGLPRSAAYGDVYFSNEGGLDEARHVFLHGNHLQQRLTQNTRMVVGEIGFGSGLNFLALWQMWEQLAPPDARLCFFSAEKHPLLPEDMARIHAHFPEMTPYAEALRAALPFHTPGYHRVYLAGGRIQLTLMYGDALEMLQAQEAQADAWFLDGFAPRLNPALWSNQLLAEIRRLSAPGATLATFSTARSTLDAVAENGFTVEKAPGFGRKKHMLQAHLPGAPHPCSPPDRITVVGGGLAGAATAHALALRGIETDVRETEKQPAAGASANPSAIFYPGITLGWQPKTQLYFSGMAYTRHWLKQLSQHPIAQSNCGMLLFAKADDKPDRMAHAMELLKPDPRALRPVDATEAAHLANVTLPKQDALFFPQSGWVNVGDLTRALLDHPKINLCTQQPVKSLTDIQTPIALCNGSGAEALLPPLAGTIQKVRGQVTHLPPQTSSQNLQTILCYGGYLTPAIDGQHHIGATYEHWRDDVIVDASSHDYNLQKLQTFLDISTPKPEMLSGWAAFRSVCKDRLPMVGAWDQQIGCNLAHASKGLLTCLLSGEYLASQWFGEPLPLPRHVANILNPHRFGTAKKNQE